MHCLEATIAVAAVLSAAYAFLGIATLVEEHLCPLLHEMCALLGIRTSIGSTLLVSLGTSLPEITIALFGAANGVTDTTIPTLLASALLASGLVPVVVVVVSGKAHLDTCVAVRDAVCLGISVGVVALYFKWNTTTYYQGLALAALYFAYIAVVFSIPGAARPNETDKDNCHDEEESEPETITTELTPLLASERDAKTFCTVASMVVTALTLPFRELFRVSLCGGVCQRFAMASCWIGVLASYAVWATLLLSRVLGVSSATAGITVLAIGATVPECIAAAQLARVAQPVSAVTQGFASQIINTTLGLGTPYFLYWLVKGEDIRTTDRDTVLAVAIYVLLALASYVCIVLWAAAGCRPRATFGYRHAATLLLVFAAFYVLCLASCESWWTFL